MARHSQRKKERQRSSCSRAVSSRVIGLKPGRLLFFSVPRLLSLSRFLNCSGAIILYLLVGGDTLPFQSLRSQLLAFVIYADAEPVRWYDDARCVRACIVRYGAHCGDAPRFNGTEKFSRDFLFISWNINCENQLRVHSISRFDFVSM